MDVAIQIIPIRAIRPNPGFRPKSLTCFDTGAVEGRLAKREVLLAIVERVNRTAQASPYYFERFIPA